MMTKKQSQNKAKQASLIPSELAERCILVIREENVLLDADLAEMYGVETRVLSSVLSVSGQPGQGPRPSADS